MISSIAQAVSAAVEVLPRHQPGEQPRPGRAGGRSPAALTDGRRGAAPRRAQQLGHDAGGVDRVDRAVASGVGQRPVRQPAVGLRGRSARTIGGQSAISYLNWRASPMPPVGWASPSRMHEVDAALVDGGDDLGAGGALDPVDAADVGGRDGGPTAVRTASRTSAGCCRRGRWPVGGVGAHAAEP